MDSRRDPGTRRASVSPTAVLFALAFGIVGYVAGLATGGPSGPSPAPSAAATVVAIVPSPSLATRAPTFPPTSQPADPPRWAWERVVVPLDENLQVESVWGLQDRVLGVASYWGDSFYLPTLSGTSWQLASAPSAVEALWGGTVVDDRVWFLASVSGLRRSEISLRLFGTDGDVNGNWRSFKPSDLRPGEPIRFLSHIDGTWVVAYVGQGGDIEIGSPQYLAWSRDGVHWLPARAPSLRGVDPFDVTFISAAATLELIVVHASVRRSGSSDNVLLVSEDGVEWREVAAPGQLDWHADLACTDTMCVLTPFALSDEPLPLPIPIAWVSTDGTSWREAETLLSVDAPGPGIAHVVAGGHGFVGVEGGRSRFAWMSSPDGRTWRRLEVLPDDLSVPVVDFAVGGGYAVALEQGPDVEPQGSWVGSLAGMQIALDQGAGAGE